MLNTDIVIIKVAIFIIDNDARYRNEKYNNRSIKNINNNLKILIIMIIIIIIIII